ncbi:uncharacterized protein G2W53_039135 [Senna tora]|uniref:Uncharacterized protein n=1 Tax=Senna tora TaxID=362788 RepID=A0A834W7N9_9FABA|nr:uncharacterized protein G2W53_039135 [Senna tora]
MRSSIYLSHKNCSKLLTDSAAAAASDEWNGYDFPPVIEKRVTHSPPALRLIPALATTYKARIDVTDELRLSIPRACLQADKKSRAYWTFASLSLFPALELFAC